MAKVINTVLSLKDDFSSTLSKVQKNATNAVSRINKSIGSATTPTEKLSKGFKAVGSEVTAMGKAFMPVSVAITGALAACVKSASEFEQAMADTWSIAKAGNDNSTEAYNTLKAAAEAAGQTGYYSATQAADALGYMALAGWDAKKSAEALPDVLNLAAAASMDLAEASDMVTDYMSAFSRTSMTTTQFTDMLSYAQNNSNTTVSQLSEAYKNCAANLNAAGQDAYTTTAALEAMANQGMKGSEAGTRMTAIMRDLTAKMKDGAVQIGKTTVKIQDAKGNYRDLTDILKDVEKATNGMGDAEKASALASVFTSDSISGLNLLLNEGVDNIEGYENALRNSAGSAADSAATKFDTLSGSLTILKNRSSEFAKSIGEELIPYVKSAADFVGKIAKSFDGLSETQKKAITAVGVFLAAIGPVLVIVGSIISAIGTVIEIIGSIGGAITAVMGVVSAIGGVVMPVLTAIGGAIAAVVGALSLPVIIIAAIVAAVVAAGIVIATHWEQTKEIASSVADAISGFFTTLFNNIKLSVAAMAADFSAAWSAIKSAASAVASAVSSFFTAAFNKIKSAVNTVASAFKSAGTAMSNAFTTAKNTINTAIEAIKTKFDSLLSKAKSVVSGIKNAFSGVSSLVSSVKSAVTGNATGTPYWTGGITRVNEYGGEIINLPSGTQIIPHDLSKQKLSESGSGVTVYLTVQGNLIGNSEYADYIGGIISNRVVTALNNS